MDERETARYWEENAHAWTVLSRQGWDVYRDYVNTPAFLQVLPPITGLRGLDIGCGEGHNTRLLAGLGPQIFAIDVAPTFVAYAKEFDDKQPAGVRYAVATAHRLPFRDGVFDFATALMSLMDMPRPACALAEIFRVLAPGGFLQFSILHPCFDTPHRKLIRDRSGEAYALEVARYFDAQPGAIDEWLFSAAPREAKAGLRPFRVPRFQRTLSEWLNDVVAAGFRIERVAEPRADDETAAKCPAVADTRIVAYFLHIRCRKPQS